MVGLDGAKWFRTAVVRRGVDDTTGEIHIIRTRRVNSASIDIDVSEYEERAVGDLQFVTRHAASLGPQSHSSVETCILLAAEV